MKVGGCFVSDLHSDIFKTQLYYNPAWENKPRKCDSVQM